MEFLLNARLIAMAWLAALAGTLVCTLYAMLRHPHLRRELGALLAVALLSAVTAARYAWLVYEKLATGISQHPRALGVLVDM
jgi:hypothetical protein